MLRTTIKILHLSTIRYGRQFVGRKTLAQIVPNVCKAAGLHSHYTGHSPKVSLATQMHAAGFDEQLIQERTGHRSLAVRRYKRTSAEQQRVCRNSYCLVRKSIDLDLLQLWTPFTVQVCHCRHQKRVIKIPLFQCHLV